MKSFEAFQESIGRDTVEHAKRLRLSLSAVSKWKEPSEDYTDSGSLNPLDRVETVIETALALGRRREASLAPIYFLAERFNLIIIALPKPGCALSDLTANLLKTIEEFGDLTREAGQALADGEIRKEEARRIEKEGNELIRRTAEFIARAKEMAK